MESSHRNLTQQVVHELGKKILQGNYKIGERLPSEADLCQQFNISRTATREAVKMLTAKGLISSRPRQGITVVESKHWNLFDVDVLNWILLGKPDLYLLRHFLQLRLALEAEAAYLAALYASDDDLIAIASALARMKNATNGMDDTHEADIAYHQSVLSASNNPFFIQLKNFITTALKVNLRFTNRMIAVTVAEYQAHVDIYEHIKNKKPQAAFDAAMVTQRATLAIVNEQIAALEQEKQHKV
ncbi:transcriptional regulator, GntR family [Colwellia chukchiensis]|uniref:Transcriptional regulator, GntR family n=1 Tax=Colwellia chukchiensis TaxID=641665 RepID=A0A1H7JND3_9GAMM|nr:FadR/GntR family transcriptional regulator [Colwellia chukchiensis]SEK76101.1 transcriptional regulator, GntR family [Colwellia chukchiensis]